MTSHFFLKKSYWISLTKTMLFFLENSGSFFDDKNLFCLHRLLLASKTFIQPQVLRKPIVRSLGTKSFFPINPQLVEKSNGLLSGSTLFFVPLNQFLFGYRPAMCSIANARKDYGKTRYIGHSQAV